MEKIEKCRICGLEGYILTDQKRQLCHNCIAVEKKLKVDLEEYTAIQSEWERQGRYRDKCKLDRLMDEMVGELVTECEAHLKRFE